MTFRARTAAVVLALTVLTMGAAFWAVWGTFVASQRGQLDDALLVVARREAAEAAAGQIEFTDAPGPSANAVGPLPKYGVLYDETGSALSHTENVTTIPPLPRGVPLATGFDFDHEGMAMRGVVVAVADGGKRILLACPRADLEEDARILQHAMLIAFLVGGAWAAAVAFVVASRLTRQHRLVGEVARKVARGDTSARVEFRSKDADLQQLADDLNAMIGRLVGLLAVQERFIAHAAHELRTPLASLDIELDQALRTARDAREYESAVRGALESTRRLARLAEDLLQLARERGGPSEDSTNVDDAVASAIADVEAVGRAREVVLVAAPCGALVRGDRTTVARILRNVLENAIRFAPPGTSVRLEGLVEGDAVELSVTDAGPGVAAEDRERIFEPFARGAGQSEGGGLGLSIARGLARSFGGDVRADAGPGGRFVVTLAAAPPTGLDSSCA